MRHFVYFSRDAVTSGGAMSKHSGGNLMKAGRMDIVMHVIVSSFFLSHGFRDDIKLHLVFYGPPDAPKHIEIQMSDELNMSKKDIGGFIKKILYKYKKGKRTEVFPGCFVEKKSFLKVIEGLQEEGNEVFVLDKNGESIRDVKIPKDCVFVLGDHEGLPKKELRRLKKMIKSVSIGNKMYFASHVVSVINNELDFREV